MCHCLELNGLSIGTDVSTTPSSATLGVKRRIALLVIVVSLTQVEYPSNHKQWHTATRSSRTVQGPSEMPNCLELNGLSIGTDVSTTPSSATLGVKRRIALLVIVVSLTQVEYPSNHKQWHTAIGSPGIVQGQLESPQRRKRRRRHVEPFAQARDIDEHQPDKHRHA